MWYVIWTTTGQEEKTRGLIEKLVDPSAYKRCLILYKNKFEKVKGVRQKVKRKLIPSYIFVETDSINEFAEALVRVPGFSVVLSSEKYFQPLKEKETLIIEKFADCGEVIDTSTGYIIGDRIIINDGPLVGSEGMIKKVNRHKRIAIIEMEMFGRVTDVTVGLEIIEKRATGQEKLIPETVDDSQTENDESEKESEQRD